MEVYKAWIPWADEYDDDGCFYVVGRDRSEALVRAGQKMEISDPYTLADIKMVRIEELEAYAAIAKEVALYVLKERKTTSMH